MTHQIVSALVYEDLGPRMSRSFYATTGSASSQNLMIRTTTRTGCIICLSRQVSFPKVELDSNGWWLLEERLME